MVFVMEVTAACRECVALWSQIFKFRNHGKYVTFDCPSQNGMFLACRTYSPVMYLKAFFVMLWGRSMVTVISLVICMEE